MARLASRLSDVCPERMNAVGTEIQSSLNAWDELGKSVAETRRDSCSLDTCASSLGTTWQ